MEQLGDARRDQRVRFLNYDEVSNTSKIEFRDGFTAVVDDYDVVSREA